jgi:hypothetical protein
MYVCMYVSVYEFVSFTNKTFKFLVSKSSLCVWMDLWVPQRCYVCSEQAKMCVWMDLWTPQC